MKDEVFLISTQVLIDLKNALLNFDERASSALLKAESEIESMRSWLEERRAHWLRQVDRAEQELATAESALEECESDGLYDGAGNIRCEGKRQNVEDARRRLELDTEQLQKVETWAVNCEVAIADYQNVAGSFRTLILERSPLAANFVETKAFQYESASRIVVPLTHADSVMVSVGSDQNMVVNRADSFGRNRQLAEALLKHETILAKRADSEKLVALDFNGNVLFEQDGEKKRVRIPANRTALLKDAIVTHNHPSGLAFSPEDLTCAVYWDMAEIRVVGVKRPYTYSLKRPLGGWPSNTYARYDTILDDVLVEFRRAVKSGKISEDQATETYGHEAMMRLSRELNLYYERSKYA